SPTCESACNAQLDIHYHTLGFAASSRHQTRRFCSRQFARSLERSTNTSTHSAFASSSEVPCVAGRTMRMWALFASTGRKSAMAAEYRRSRGRETRTHEWTHTSTVGRSGRDIHVLL